MVRFLILLSASVCLAQTITYTQRNAQIRNIDSFSKVAGTEKCKQEDVEALDVETRSASVLVDSQAETSAATQCGVATASVVGRAEVEVSGINAAGSTSVRVSNDDIGTADVSAVNPRASATVVANLPSGSLAPGERWVLRGNYFMTCIATDPISDPVASIDSDASMNASIDCETHKVTGFIPNVVRGSTLRGEIPHSGDFSLVVSHGQGIDFRVQVDLPSASASGNSLYSISATAGVGGLRLESWQFQQGDANFDGQVSFADFLVLSGNFGMSGASWEDGDFDDDGTVGMSDFLLLSSNW